jgi:hypothetical protein
MHDMERGGIEIVNILTDQRESAAAAAELSQDSRIIAFDKAAGTTPKRGR